MADYPTTFVVGGSWRRAGPLRPPGGALLVTFAVLQILQGRTEAMVINGTDMTMDQAIMAAAGSSKVFRLMEDANVVRVEMDMLFKTDVWESMMRARESAMGRHRRKVTRHQQFRWPNAVIPYQIAVSWSDRDHQQFQDALSDYHRYTCVRFRQASSSDRDYLRIVDGGGCSSYVGRQGGEQIVSLASGCRHKGIIIHELGHALGFQHEQTRPDRDSYVYVAEENIDSYMLFNFEKYTAAEVDTGSVPYDYLSVMHYGEYAFSRNGQRTIRTRDPAYQSRIGNRGGLSFRDVQLVNSLYACAARNRCPARQCPDEGFVGPDCVCWCPSQDSRSVTQCSVTMHVTQAPATQLRTVGRPTQPSPVRPQQTTQPFPVRPQQTTLPSTASSRRATVVGATTARWRPCHDANDMCSAWARRGECDANPRYMFTHCASSCRSCDGATAAVAECRDLEVHCDHWRGRGYCSSKLYAAYMQQHCPRACGVCSAAASAKTAAVRTTPVAVAATTTKSKLRQQTVQLKHHVHGHKHETRHGGDASRRHDEREEQRASKGRREHSHGDKRKHG